MNWLYYLLEANLYLVLFYGFYRLFLQNETFYNLNRYFLLLSTLLSFTLPILQLGSLKHSIEQANSNYLMHAGEAPPIPVEPTGLITTGTPLTDVNWLYVFYLFVAFCFAIKLGFSVYKIISIWLKAKKYTAGDITLVEVNDESTAFSFFNLLFIHPELADQTAVIKHEMVHIEQRHSFDVVFFELVQVICWFNPILHFIKKDIKLLHEYIADELTTNNDMQKHEYALFLIQNSFGLKAQPITNQIFNQSILKRRINMLNKKRTAGWARLRLLLTLPLAGAMLCTSTMAFTKDYGYLDLLPEKSNVATLIQENPKVENIKKSSVQKKQDLIKFPPTFKPKEQNRYRVEFRTDPKTGKPLRLDNRYIVANGKPLENQNKFYGAANTESVTILNPTAATKKYGNNGAKGAVELTGSKIIYSDQIAPPPPRVETVRFPPPIVKPDRNYFHAKRDSRLSSTNPRYVEKRYIVVNGEPITDTTFYGVVNASRIKHLLPKDAIAKYGEQAKFGAVEITGGKISYVIPGQLLPPPPIEEPPTPRKKTPPPPPKQKAAVQPLHDEPAPKILNIKLKEQEVIPTNKILNIKLKEQEVIPTNKILNIKLKEQEVTPVGKILNIKLKEGNPTGLKLNEEIKVHRNLKRIASAKMAKNEEIKNEIQRQVKLQLKNATAKTNY